MAFEKEKKRNHVAMALGLAAAAAGLVLYFFGSRTVGVLLLIAGVAILVIAWKISDVIFKVEMKEMSKKRK